MDSFTAQANPGNITQGEKGPSSFLRTIFLFLLIITLAAAGVTTYLLLSRRAAPPQTVSTTETENPFAATTEANATNPFAEATLSQSGGETVNPFADEVPSDNPFSQFDTTTTSNTSGTGDYDNPF